LATAIIGLALLCVGIGILWNGLTAVWHFWQGDALQRPGGVALAAALVSVLSKEAVYRYTIRAGKRCRSQAVIANAWHHRSDALSSIGTAIGIGGAFLLGERWCVLDPLAAIVVSIFIIRVAIQLLVPCINELLEKSLPPEIEEEIEQTILSFPGVCSPHHLRTRRIGNHFAMEVHVRMDGHLSLEEAHRKATEIEIELRRRFGNDTHIGIHVEPIK
ncbi:MAG: cation diffusion facilitator family transporter, partial [Alloprevotella sp.]